MLVNIDPNIQPVIATQQQHGTSGRGCFRHFARPDVDLEHPSGHRRAYRAAGDLGIEFEQLRTRCGNVRACDRQVGLALDKIIAGDEPRHARVRDRIELALRGR